MDLKTYLIEGPRGRATQLALQLGISPSYLSQMASGVSTISPERIVAIEQATDAIVNRKDQFPDDWQKIWPELAGPTHIAASESKTNQEMRRETDLGYRQPANSKQVDQ